MRPWIVLGLFVSLGVVGYGERDRDRDKTFDDVVRKNAERMLEEGRRIFRFDTFGDEAFWGGALKLHQAIAGERNGGVGPGVSPATALAVGLKVDVEALPRRRAQGDPARPRESERSGGHARAARARTPSSASPADARRRRPPRRRRHPVLAVPLDRRRLGRARHRPAPRRLAEPRSRTSARSSRSRPISASSPICCRPIRRRCARC